MEYIGSLAGHGGHVASVKFVNPFTLVSGARDKKLIAWDLTKTSSVNPAGVPVRSMIGHSHFVSSVDVNKEGTHAVSTSWDGRVMIWNLENGACENKVTIGNVSKPTALLTVTYDNNGERILVAGRDNKVTVLTSALTEEAAPAFAKAAHADWISCIKALPGNNEQFVTVGWDRVAKLVDATDAQEVINFTGHTGYLNTVACAENAPMFATAGNDGSICIWTVKDNQAMFTYKLQANQEVTGLVFDDVERRLIAVGDKYVQVFDLTTFSLVNSFEIPASEESPKTPRALSVDICGGKLAVGASDNKIHVFSL